MKQIFLTTIFACMLVYTGTAQTADPFADFAQPNEIKVGTTTNLEVTIGNLGTSYNGSSDIVAGSLVITITAGSNAEILGLNSAFVNDSRFTVSNSTTGTGNFIELVNTGGPLKMTNNDADAIGTVNLLIKGKTVSQQNFKALVSYLPGYSYQGDADDGNNHPTINFSVLATLPVNLISFTAASVNNQSVINWEYNNALNFSHFELQRSSDGTSFTNLSSKQYTPAYNQTVTASVSETDKSPLNGNNYYRLKMIDLDGSIMYSKIVKLQFKLFANALNIFPNPAKDFINVELIGTSNGGKIKIYNANAIVVYQAKLLSSKGKIQTSTLPQGVYVLEVTDDNGKRIGVTNFLKIR